MAMGLKYAFMSFSCPQASFDGMLALANRYGYDGVEPRIDAGHAHGIEPNIAGPLRGEFRRKATDAALAIACIATSCRYSDPQTTELQLSLTRRCIDLAADIGAPRIRVFGGAVPPGVSREEAIDHLAASLGRIATHAAARDVVVCVETHDDWCNPLHMAEVMKRADHPSVAVNWDIMHTLRQGGATMDQAFAILRPWIRHAHVHDGLLQPGDVVLKPIGQGEIDHRRAVELLQGMNYDGYLSGEWIDWEPPETHLPRELAILKSYEQQFS